MAESEDLWAAFDDLENEITSGPGSSDESDTDVSVSSAVSNISGISNISVNSLSMSTHSTLSTASLASLSVPSRHRRKRHGGGRNQGVSNTDLQQIHNELTRIDLLEHDHQTLKQTVNQQSLMRHQVEELARSKQEMQSQVAMLLRQIQALEATPTNNAKDMKQIKDEQEGLNKLMRKQTHQNANYNVALKNIREAIHTAEDHHEEKMKELETKVQQQNKAVTKHLNEQFDDLKANHEEVENEILELHSQLQLQETRVKNETTKQKRLIQEIQSDVMDEVNSGLRKNDQRLKQLENEQHRQEFQSHEMETQLETVTGRVDRISALSEEANALGVELESQLRAFQEDMEEVHAFMARVDTQIQTQRAELISYTDRNIATAETRISRRIDALEQQQNARQNQYDNGHQMLQQVLNLQQAQDLQDLRERIINLEEHQQVGPQRLGETATPGSHGEREEGNISLDVLQSHINTLQQDVNNSVAPSLQEYKLKVDKLKLELEESEQKRELELLEMRREMEEMRHLLRQQSDASRAEPVVIPNMDEEEVKEEDLDDFMDDLTSPASDANESEELVDKKPPLDIIPQSVNNENPPSSSPDHTDAAVESIIPLSKVGNTRITRTKLTRKKSQNANSTLGVIGAVGAVGLGAAIIGKFRGTTQV